MITTDIFENARAQVAEYWDVLPLLLPELEKRYSISAANDVLTQNIESFLGVKGLAEVKFEEIIGRSSKSLDLLAQSFHFSRKTALKNYEHRDPVPLVHNTFDALVEVDDAYAARFLSEICKFMTEDDKNQRNIYGILGVILPAVSNQYQTAVAASQGTDPRRINHARELDRLKEDYKRKLDALLDYVKIIVRRPTAVSLQDFEFYARHRPK